MAERGIALAVFYISGLPRSLVVFYGKQLEKGRLRSRGRRTNRDYELITRHKLAASYRGCKSL